MEPVATQQPRQDSQGALEDGTLVSGSRSSSLRLGDSGATPATPSSLYPGAATPARSSSKQADTGGTEGVMNSPEGFADVHVHIYHCDSFTAFLNQAGLKRADMGIFHAGVEVFEEEVCFQYYEDTWEDPYTSGVNRCVPKMMPGYEYVESVNLGPTPLSVAEADRVVIEMSQEWPASSYHVTRRNCLTFAEALAARLRAPRPFPPHLKGILEASNNNRPIDAIVDYSWSWMKWWMIRATRQEQAAEEAARVGGSTLGPASSCADGGWLLGACSTTGLQQARPPAAACPDAGDEHHVYPLGGASETEVLVGPIQLPEKDRRASCGPAPAALDLEQLARP